jgi:hypothetical protein
MHSRKCFSPATPSRSPSWSCTSVCDSWRGPCRTRPRPPVACSPRSWLWAPSSAPSSGPSSRGSSPTAPRRRSSRCHRDAAQITTRLRQPPRAYAAKRRDTPTRRVIPEAPRQTIWTWPRWSPHHLRAELRPHWRRRACPLSSDPHRAIRWPPHRASHRAKPERAMKHPFSAEEVLVR